MNSIYWGCSTRVQSFQHQSSLSALESWAYDELGGLGAILVNDRDRLRSLLCVSCASLRKCLFIYCRLYTDVIVATRHQQNCLMAFIRSHPPNTHTHSKISHSLNNCAFHTNSVITLLSARQRETWNILQSTSKTLGKNNPPRVPAVHVESQQTCLFPFTSSVLMLQLKF